MACQECPGVLCLMTNKCKSFFLDLNVDLLLQIFKNYFQFTHTEVIKKYCPKNTKKRNKLTT